MTFSTEIIKLFKKRQSFYSTTEPNRGIKKGIFVSETKLFISGAKHEKRCNTTYHLNLFLKGRYLRNKECDCPNKNEMSFVSKMLKGRNS